MGTESPKIIAVIAARGRSRRLPRKNLCLFLGKPMLQWVIQTCRESRRIDDVVVSSEDAEILDLARKLNCRIVVRPAEMAEDHIPQIEVVRHAVTVVEKEQGLQPEVVVMIQANSPEVRPKDLDRAIEKLESRNLYEVISLDQDLIHDGSFRVFRRKCLFNTFGAYTGAIRTDYVDIHTAEDLEAAESRYGTAEKYLETRR